MSKPTITLLALHLSYGGVEKYISSLCEMLKEDYDLHIICTYQIAKQPAFYFDDRISITYLIDEGPNKMAFQKALAKHQLMAILKVGMKSLKLLYLKLYRNMRAIKQVDSTYIITTRPFHSCLVGWLAPKHCIKIATEHNDCQGNMHYTQQLAQSIKHFDYLVCVSQPLKDYLESKVSIPCVYIPNVLDTLPILKPQTPIYHLISIGRLEAEKGYDDLIEVVALVKKQIPNIALVLIGDGSLKTSLQQKINDLQLQSNILLTGYLDTEKIANYLDKSRLFVMTSHTESFGIVLIEAMSHQVPCIAFDSANGAKTILQEAKGILIGNRDKKAMATAIVQLLYDEKQLQGMGEMGYVYCQRYLASHVQVKWQALLQGG